MRVPVLTAVIFAILIVASDIYIYLDILHYSSQKRRKVYCWIDIVATILCWGLTVVFLCLPKRNPEDDLVPVMWILYTLLTIYIPKFIYCICSMLGRVASLAYKRKTGKRHNFGVPVGFFLALLVFIILWWGVIFTRHDIVVNNVEIDSPRLPDSFDGYRVALFSDIHLGTWGNDTTFIASLVDSINAQNPDLILFAGDIMNRQSSEMKPFLKTLRRLKAKDGVYGIFGNHDYCSYVDWENQEDYYADLRRRNELIDSLGWTIFANQSRFIKSGNDSIALIGVENWGEPPFGQYGQLEDAYVSHGDGDYGLNDNNFKILMSHNPVHWDKVVTNISNIDLTVSGHTHAMQTVLKVGNWKWSPAIFRYNLWGGLYKKEAKDGTVMDLYVSIGAGEVGFPARIGAANPEVTMFTLRKGDETVK